MFTGKEALQQNSSIFRFDRDGWTFCVFLDLSPSKYLSSPFSLSSLSSLCPFDLVASAPLCLSQALCDPMLVILPTE